MRYLVPLAVLILAQIGAAWAVGDTNLARPGGAFATIETATAAACERACADDTLCMAWSFQASACELKAIVPAAIAREGVVSGVSARAPASMRIRYEPAPPPVIEPARDSLARAESAPPAAQTAQTDVAFALLGGPETDSGLRGGLGN